MKNTLLILTLLFTGFFQNIFAQDLSAFYQAGSENSNINYNKKSGYTTTSIGNTTGKLSFTPINDATTDIKFTFTVLNAVAQESVFKINVGNVNYEIPTGDARTEIIKVDGKIQNNRSYYISLDNDAKTEGETKSTLYFTLRIGKNYVRAFYDEGGMEGTQLGEKYQISNRDINIEVVSKDKTTMKVEVDTDYLLSLSSYAENGLKIRKSANLNAPQIGSIRDRDQVFVLENMDGDDYRQYYDYNSKGTLKVGNLSSRMVKVLYKDKVGYAYGGYLFPFYKEKYKWSKTKSSLDGWRSGEFSMDEIFSYHKRSFRTIDIYFEHGLLGDIDPSQKAFLLTKLFPNAFTIDKINTLIQANKKHTFEVDNSNYTEYFEVTVKKNQLVSVVYKEIKKGFFKEIKNQQKGYVVASSLNMRESANPKSKVLTKIPMSSSVKFLDTSGDFLTLGGIRGKMVKVEYKGKEGYVFDAYLSPVKPFPSAKTKKLVDYKLEDTFIKTIKKRGNKVWEHNNSFRSSKAVVPSRDVFQALKTFRKLYPPVNDLVFKWNESKNEYDISSTSKKIEVSKSDYDCFITVGGINDASASISIVKLGENLYLVEVSYNEVGC